MKREGLLALACTVELTLLGTSARSQEKRVVPAFTAGVEVVRLDVSVTDGSGRFVTDLGSGDLQIEEDGRPQAPTSFMRRELPVSLVLLLDTSGSVGDRLQFSQAAAAGFLEGLRPEDEAMVVEFNDRVHVLEDWTSDREALRRAVTRASTGDSTALYNALYTTLRTVPEGGRDASLRRRAIVLLSDGADTASLVWEEQVLELARRREAAIHVIDLRPAEATRSSRLLRVLGEESGGELHRPASIHDLDAVYARIREQLRSEYTIGYVSSNPAQDGRWRQVTVRVRGRKDLRVRHRAGYYAVP